MMNRLPGKVLLAIMLILVTTGYSQSNRVADSLERVFAHSRDPKEQTEILLAIAVQYELHDPQKALQFTRQAEKIIENSMHAKEYSHVFLEYAKIYYILSDLNRAMESATKAKEIAEKNDLKWELALSMDAIGIVYYEIGDENKCSDCFFASLRIYENLKDKKGIGQSFCRIGTLYYNQKENAKAVDYYQKSIDIAKELDNVEGIASNLNNIATVYTSENKIDKALPLYIEALRLNISKGNTQLEGTNYLNIGNLYLKLGKYDSAMANVRRAMDIFTRLGNQVRYTKAKLTQGEIFLGLNQYDLGLVSAKEALDISQQNGFKESVSEAAGLLHRLYLLKYDTIRAYRYAMLENAWKDSLSLGENKKTLAKLEMQYQFEKKEQQLKIEKQRKNFFIIMLGVIALFSIIVIILLWLHYRLHDKKALLEKESLEKDLDYKKKELTANVMSLMKKNEMLSEITKKIIRIKQESEQEETRTALKKVISELQKSTDEEILKEFSLRFREVHKDFYDTLLLKYPGLSPSELKLCAFLRLNMTTKEIAELTGQQISTLENARYRLRQKLGITSSEVNLVTFLAQI